MRRNYLAILTIGTVMTCVPSVRGHHAFAAEYSLEMMTLTGKISKVEWTNPHTYLHIDVTDTSGKVTAWALEGYPPNTLKRTGFARDLLKIGDTVTVTAYKSKDGSNTGQGREVTFPDGSKKFLGPVGR